MTRARASIRQLVSGQPKFANMPAKPVSQSLLTLDSANGSPKQLSRIIENISAIALQSNNLWAGGDEGTFIDRFTRKGNDEFGAHHRFDLGPLVNLPARGDTAPEIDIEGLDWAGGYLWFLGSHSLKRKKPEAGKSTDENRRRLAKLEADGNRYTLARVPLDSGFNPSRKNGARTAARLKGDERGNVLTEALASDKHIGPFLKIPGKDNGLDLEGLAVRGSRVFAGMRGPVLRRWSIILDLELADAKSGELTLVAAPRKHFLDLEGLGVRELSLLGNDLYILAGPTMDLDGPVFLYRWPNAIKSRHEELVTHDQLQKLLAIPFGKGGNAGRDHAEGLAVTRRNDGSKTAMICYDSPAKARRVGKCGILLDVFLADPAVG